MKKCIWKILFFVVFLLIIPLNIYADDEDIELDFSHDFFNSLEVLSNDVSNIPDINARHAIVFDRASKLKIFGKKECEKCKMASTTKIMTAIIVLENCNLDDIITISAKSASTGGSRLGLKKGDKITVHDLLYGLLLRSGNDAAIALAEHVSDTNENFSTLMNKKAKALNLTSTHFVTPHGLDDDNHYTTALDLALLTDYALQNSFFLQTVRTKNYTITINGYPKNIGNTNELLGNFDGIYGVKTGFTNGANRCLVTSCKRDDLDVICVVLGCDTKKDRTKDSLKLLNYTFNNFSLINVKDILINNFNGWKSEHYNSFVISKGVSQIPDLYLNSQDIVFSHIAVNKSDIDKISTDISFNSFFDAPLKVGSAIGELSLNINGSSVMHIKILNSNSIPKKNCFDYILYILKNYCHFFTTT